MIHTRCLSILDSMWGNPGKAPGLFRINPRNHSGRRLYWLLGHNDLWVTNACREQMANSKEHGTPDPEWLAENLQRLTYDLLLICGKVAAQTFDRAVPLMRTRVDCRLIVIPHPAARGKWNKAFLENTRGIIQTGVH